MRIRADTRNRSIIVVAARLVLGLTRGAQRRLGVGTFGTGTSIRQSRKPGPGASYRNIFTGQVLALEGRLLRGGGSRIARLTAGRRFGTYLVSKELGLAHPAAGIAAAKFRVRSLRPLGRSWGHGSLTSRTRRRRFRTRFERFVPSKRFRTAALPPPTPTGRRRSMLAPMTECCTHSAPLPGLRP